MKKNNQSIPQETQLFLLTKLNKVQQELNKLSHLVSSNQQLNNNYIKKYLDENSVQSDSSQELGGNTQRVLTVSDKKEESVVEYNSELYEANETFSETISKLSIIKSKESDGVGVIKLQEQGFLCTMAPEVKQNIRTQQNNLITKPNSAKKQKQTFKETNSLQKPGWNQIKMKPKKVSNKNSHYLMSGNRSKNNLDSKKAKQISSPHVSKRKSTKPDPSFQFRQESHHVFQNRGKSVEKGVLGLVSPKLNKINGNKFRENLKKTIEIQKQEGLQPKFHLNLSEQKSLMHRMIQKNRYEKVYEEQTKKYQLSMKSLTDTIIMGELDSDFRKKSESLKLIMIFLSQFSETIRKFFNDKPQEIELKFTELIKETITMLMKLPSKLYRNNYVSSIRYESLISSKIGVHKASSKLQQAVQALKEYMIFLSRNGLIEMTERVNPHSDRKIGNYYSHRSKKDKSRNRARMSDDFKEKISSKYDTERQCKNNNNNTSRPIFEIPKKIKSPEAKPISTKIEKKPSEKTKPPMTSNLSKVRSEGALKTVFKKNISMENIKKRP